MFTVVVVVVVVVVDIVVCTISFNVYAINQSQRVNCWLLLGEVPTFKSEVRTSTHNNELLFFLLVLF